MYSIMNLFSAHYWFSYVEPINALSFWVMLAFYILMLVAAIVISQMAKMEKVDKPLRRGLRKIIRALVWLGILGLVILFFRYELVYILSRRFLLGLWVVGLILWVVTIVRYFVKDMPRHRAAIEEQNRLKKYLP